MHVALVSIGHCPSLALRNLRSYCLSDPEVAAAATFRIHDYDCGEFRNSRVQSSQQWSFVTRFDRAVQEISRSQPRLVAFTCYLWNIELSLHMAHVLKRVVPQVRTVFGGPDAGPRAVHLLQRYEQVDFVVQGDGEIPFLELVRQHLAGPPAELESVPSLRYRRGDSVQSNPLLSEPVDMSRLLNVYDRPPDSGALAQWSWPYLLVETLRGCPYACSYCMYGKTRLNEKDPDSAVDEIARLLRTGALVEIIDPTFTTYQKRAKYILGKLGQNDHRGRLTFEAYPDSIDEEMADLIGKGPVSCLGMGFQTLSTEGLKAVKRPKNLARFERAVGLLRQRHIAFYVDIIYGLPGTGVDDFLATVDYLFSLGITELMIYRLLGLPGSPMMDDAEKYALVFSDSPPYELLSSNQMTLDEIIFCESFRQAYSDLLVKVPSGKVDDLARRAGGVSRIVNSFLDFERSRRGAVETEPISKWLETLAWSGGLLEVGEAAATG